MTSRVKNTKGLAPAVVALGAVALTVGWLNSASPKPYERAHEIGLEQDALLAVHMALTEKIGPHGVVLRMGESSAISDLVKLESYAKNEEVVRYVRANRENYRVPMRIQGKRIDDLARLEPLVVLVGSPRHYSGVTVDGTLLKEK